jgi:nicotinate-nucleotide adenylyltransferase
VWRFVCKGEAKVRQGFPQAQAGMVIGLLGGSFDPAHAGHAHITREALKRFGLDRVWWLVSPGNPLKAEGPAPLATRIAQARSVIDDPRVVITGLEVLLGTRHTAALLDRLTAIYPGVRFVWLMGADNLVQFHRWDRWHSILARVPVGVMARLWHCGAPVGGGPDVPRSRSAPQGAWPAPAARLGLCHDAAGRPVVQRHPRAGRVAPIAGGARGGGPGDTGGTARPGHRLKPGAGPGPGFARFMGQRRAQPYPQVAPRPLVCP